MSEDALQLVERGSRILEHAEPFDTAEYLTASDAAAVFFRHALHLDPTLVPALVGLGKCLSFEPTRSAEARSHLERALEYEPENADVHFELGLLLLRTGERSEPSQRSSLVDSSIQHLMRAQELNYAEESCLFNLLGTAYFRMGAFREAQRWFQASYEAIVREGSWIPSTFFLAARACIALDDPSGAAAWYERGLSDGRIDGLNDSVDRQMASLRRIAQRPVWLQRILMRMYRFAWDESASSSARSN
jgi:tetratricopeptide (TPR) repeat protein